MDVYFPDHGFSFITLSWLENVGLCGPGEAGAFIEANWDKEAGDHRRPNAGQSTRGFAFRRRDQQYATGTKGTT